MQCSGCMLCLSVCLVRSSARERRWYPILSYMIHVRVPGYSSSDVIVGHQYVIVLSGRRLGCTWSARPCRWCLWSRQCSFYDMRECERSSCCDACAYTCTWSSIFLVIIGPHMCLERKENTRKEGIAREWEWDEDDRERMRELDECCREMECNVYAREGDSGYQGIVIGWLILSILGRGGEAQVFPRGVVSGDKRKKGEVRDWKGEGDGVCWTRHGGCHICWEHETFFSPCESVTTWKDIYCIFYVIIE